MASLAWSHFEYGRIEAGCVLSLPASYWEPITDLSKGEKPEAKFYFFEAVHVKD